MNCVACEDSGYLAPTTLALTPDGKVVQAYEPCPCKKASDTLYGTLITFVPVTPDSRRDADAKDVENVE